MLHEILLLTEQAAQQLALTELLKAHNPRLTFRYALTADDLSAIDPASLRHSRLLAFTTGTIVPPRILEALGHGAYNFHPGPPDYPGWAPAHFAHYDGARMFGATAHRMTEQVDAGPIVGIETFAIPDNIGVRELEQIAFVRLAYLFWRLSRDLATRAEPLPALPLRWSGIKSTRRMYASMCQITPAMSAVELARRVAAFHDDFRAIYPTITLHGFQFRLAPGPARPIDMEPGPSARSVEAPLQVALDAPALAHG